MATARTTPLRRFFATSTVQQHFARRAHAPTAPMTPARPLSVEEAVTNILYNTPIVPAPPPQRHVLNCLVTDEPGVLSRVAGILAARGVNIDSLVVSKTDVRDLSRMTVAIKGQAATVEQAAKQLEDLVPVWAVLDYTHTRLIEREMLLAKVSLVPAALLDQMAHHDGADEENGQSALGSVDRRHKHSSIDDQLLAATHAQLAAVSRLASLFGAKVADVSSETAVVELCAKSERIDAFLKLMHPFGLVEVARSGMMAMTRTPVAGAFDTEAQEIADDDSAAVALEDLPPS
ncbi:acetolactate synthase I/III small subunit [Blastocladiella britannica]|nr:acetolactate synthase I/III small subunit [Blastocladiella britannica]